MACKVNARNPFCCARSKFLPDASVKRFSCAKKDGSLEMRGDVPSLKLRASSPLKNGVTLNYFPFGAKGLFSGAFAVSFREGISLLALLVWF